MTTLLAKNVES